MSFEVGAGCCQILCDQNGAFLARFKRTCEAGEAVAQDLDAYTLTDPPLPYTPVGVITQCSPINQFEGLTLNPLCDINTGLVVGYFAVTRTEEDPQVFETLYFDTTGASIPSQPVNSEVCLPKECLEPVGILCYTIERECEDPPINDYGPWQGGLGDQPVTSTQQLCTGETLNITWDNFVSGQIVNSAMSAGDTHVNIAVFGGPGITRQLTLAWDQPLRGPFAFIIENVTPGDEDVPVISPAPDSVTPAFGAGDLSTQHQIYYEDITGINLITIDLEVIAQASGTFIVYMDESVPISVVLEEDREVIVYANTCQEPPVTTYYYNDTGEQILDLGVIAELKNCELSYDCNNPLRVEDCVMKWDRDLCDRQDTVIALDIYSFDSDTEVVTRINALTGAVLDSHSPVGVDWTNGTVYDASGGFYYLYDGIAGEWHRYDATNLASGNTNLGVFGGDPIVGGGFTFGAFDPTTGFGYVGSGSTTRYRIDFDALTVLDLPAFNGELGAPFTQISSLSITEAGLHYVTSYQGASVQNAFYIANPLTGDLTHLGTEQGLQLNGSDYDQDTLSGWYGTDANLSILYRWTLPSGSDIAQIGTLANPGGTLGVGRATITSIRTPFQRVYHKDLATNQITHQDHDYAGTPYEVLGTPEPCPVSVEPANVPIISCYVDQNGDHFSAITLIDSDGQIVSTLVDGTVTDTSAGTLRLEPCSLCVQDSHIVDLGTGQTWTPASLPAGGVVTGMTVNIITQAVDNSIIDSDGTALANAPAGLSMSWNSDNNCGFLTPPQSIFAGTGGRIIINMTLRDDS